MNRILLWMLAGLSVLRADYHPSAWHSAPLENADRNLNEWYLFPTAAKAPRVLVKATTANNVPAYKVLTGGPPEWTAGASTSMGQINKQGVFVPRPDGGGYLVAPHNTASLKVAIIDSFGNVSLETIDSNSGNFTGISAELDADGVLHVAYAWNGGTLCYARRTGTGATPWHFTSQNLPSTSIHETAVVPFTLPAAGVHLYYTASAMGVRSLWHSKPGIFNKLLLIMWGANPRVEVERYVAAPLRGSRTGPTGRLFFFGSENTSVWKLKRHVGTGSPFDVETAGVGSPKSIHVATGPDGLQRVAWYNPSARRIHYLKPFPGGADLPTLGGYPVETTGLQTDADLLGFHIDAAGVPYLLYRTALNNAFIAFPNDEFDTDGNGRAQILDNALDPAGPGFEALAPGPAISGIPNSANRFKFRFSTVGSAGSNGAGSVISNARNFVYSIETSDNFTTWTPVTGASSVNFFQVASSGNNPDQIRTYVGVLPGDAPGTAPRRFARLKVTRSFYPY